MKVLIYTTFFSPEIGAPPIRLSNIAAQLLRLGHQVEVVTAMPNYPSGKIFEKYRGRLYLSEEEGGIPVARAWVYATRSTGIGRLASYISFMIISLPLFIGRCLRFKPDFVLGEFPPPFFLLNAVLLRQIVGYRLIVNVADLWPEALVEMGAFKANAPVIKIMSRLVRFLLLKADIVNIVIPSMRQQIEDKGVATSKIIELRNGVDLGLFAPGIVRLETSMLQRAMEIARQHSIVLYAGNMGTAHNLRVVLEVAKVLGHNRDIFFLLVGDGADKQQLLDLSTRYQLKNLEFWGAVCPEEVADLFRICTVGLCMSRIEGISSKIFPIMSSAKPVLYCGYGDGVKLVRDSSCGIAIEAHDPELIAQELEQLLQNPDQMSGMGVRGRAYVEEQFSWKLLVERWAEAVCESSRIQNKDAK